MSKEPWHVRTEERIEKETQSYDCHSTADSPSYSLQCKHNKAHGQKNFVWMHLGEDVKSYPALVCPDRNADHYSYEQQIQYCLRLVVLKELGWIYNEDDCVHQQYMKRPLQVWRKRKGKDLEHRDTCGEHTEYKEELLDPIVLEKSCHSLEIVVIDVGFTTFRNQQVVKENISLFSNLRNYIK